MLKLFAVMLGGRAPGCNTELHDVVFVVSDNIQNAYPKLVKKWFGEIRSLHIDSVAEVSIVDGHEISFSKTKPATTKKLFFVNLGGYEANYFGERHEADFFVADEIKEAVAKAKSRMGLNWHLQHTDDKLVVDDILEVQEIDGYHLCLTPIAKPSNIVITSDYFRLDVPEILEKAL